MKRPYACAYNACNEDQVEGGLCVRHAAYVFDARTTLDAEEWSDW